MNGTICPLSPISATLLLLTFLPAITGSGYGQNDQSLVKAPPNHAVLSNTINGWYFVPITFKQNYETTLTRLETLQANVDQGRLSAAEAQAELADLKQRLAALRKDMEANRVHVAGKPSTNKRRRSSLNWGRKNAWRSRPITCMSSVGTNPV